MVVVHGLERAGAEDAEHLRHHHLPARAGVVAGQLHRGQVRRAQFGVDGEDVGRTLHLALADTVLEAPPPGHREEARSGAMPEAARAEVHADPDAAVLVAEQIDVVVSCAHGSELLGGQPGEPALGLEVRPCGSRR